MAEWIVTLSDETTVTIEADDLNAASLEAMKLCEDSGYLSVSMVDPTVAARESAIVKVMKQLNLTRAEAEAFAG